MKAVVGDAVAERLRGEQPSRIQALAAAGVAAAVTGVAVYKLLRSSSSGDDEAG
jgi:hypothetical protein